MRIRERFNPRAPCGARRESGTNTSSRQCYFNPRAPCGARLSSKSERTAKPTISTHAPREGRDGQPCERGARLQPRISIHAPREGRDSSPLAHRRSRRRFQSTRPARGATRAARYGVSPHRYFNPRAPRGARPCRQFQALVLGLKISIHAPREGRDSKSEQISLHIFAKKAWIPDIFAQNAAFQSVLPLADRQKLLYLRCEPLRKFLRAFASHYKIIGSSGRYVCLQPKCSILFSYFLPK